MPQPLSAETATARAIKRNPASMTKVARGQRSAKPARFQALTLSELLATRRDPRDVLLEIAETETSALADKLKCSMLEAQSERRLAAGLVLPYVSQRLPTQIDMRSTRAITLNIVDEKRYQELIEVAAEPDDSDGSFSMQMLPTTSAEQPSPTPPDTPQAAPQTPTPRQERALQWDIEPGNKGMQRKNVTTIEPVTPPAGEPLPTSLQSESAWWDSVSGGARTRPLEDRPAGDDATGWRKSDTGTFGPGRPK